jgi:hypothetical protein
MLRPARLALAFVLLSSLASCTSPPAPTACPTATASPTPPPPPTPTATAPPPTPSPPPECSSITIYREPGCRVDIPCGAVAGDATFTLRSCTYSDPSEPLEPTPSVPLVPLRSVDLQLLTWDNRPSPLDTTWSFRFIEPVTVTFELGNAFRYIDLDRAAVYHRRRGSPKWQKLAALVDRSARLVAVRTRDIGCFRLLAPEPCPEDVHEPDDDWYGAFANKRLHVNGPALRSVLATVDDEDWFMLWAVTGVTYTAETRDLGPGVDTLLTVLYKGEDLVAAEEKVMAGASHLEWQVAEDGAYYVIVRPAPGSATGCDAFYSLALTAPPARLTLLYDGLVEYETSTGWVTFPDGGAVLDPGLYSFRFDGEWVEYRVRSGEQRERVAIVKLVDSAGEALRAGPVEFRDREGGWLLAPSTYLPSDQSTWACPVPEEQTVLEVRMSRNGVTAEKSQDISADPVIVFQTGRVRSTSGACTHYWNGSEWRPPYGGEFLPQTYTFRFDDGTPDTEYTVVAGEETVIH